VISFLIDAVLNRLFSSCTTKFVCGSAAWTFACLFTFARCRYSIVIRRICCSSYLAFSPIWSDINRYDLWAIRCDLPTLETAAAAADGDDDDDDDDDDDEGNDESERWVRTEELTLTAVVGASPQLSPWCEWSQLFCDSFLTHMYNITKNRILSNIVNTLASHHNSIVKHARVDKTVYHSCYLYTIVKQLI